MSNHSSKRKGFEGSEMASTPRAFGTAQEAWVSSLLQLFNFGKYVAGVRDTYSVGSAFGAKIRNTKELVFTSFSIDSPRERLILSKQRPIDLGYAVANIIWVLTGSDHADMISFYNPNGRRFSDDGKCLFSAPGARIFASSEGDQFEQAVARLKKDPTTRRAVIQIFSPADLFADSRDCSCLVSLQFILRENSLSCLAYMRSQSALMVMPYDIFLLSMIHEAVSICVGVEPGAYHHLCGSLHYYDDEEELVRAVLEEDVPIPSVMPNMLNISAAVRAQLAVAEQDIRNRLKEDILTPINTNHYGLDDYWTELLNVLLIGTRKRYGHNPLEDELAGISNIYRSMLIAR
jgi:thymidylate synthase